MSEENLYIDWELECLPDLYSKPRSDEYIDRVTLTHVICNVRKPEGVDEAAFYTVMDHVARTLDRFPYFKPGEARIMTLEEVVALEHSDDTVFVEDMKKPYYGEMAFVGTVNGMAGEYRICFGGQKSRFIMSSVDYGQRWRCWTARPEKKDKTEEKQHDA